MYTDRDVSIDNYYTLKDYGFVKVIGICPNEDNPRITDVCFKTVADNKPHDMPMGDFKNSIV